MSRQALREPPAADALITSLVAALRALPRLVETDVETGIGMFTEVVQRADGPWVDADQMHALLDQFEAARRAAGVGS